MKKPLHIHQEVRANPNKLDKIPKCFFKEIDGSSFEILIQTKNVMYSEVQNVMQTSAHYIRFRSSDFLNFDIILF